MWKWLKARWKDSPLVFLLVSLLVGLAMLFLVILPFETPTWAYYIFGIKKKFRILQFLGIAMGGVLLAIQAVTAHRRAKAMEKTAKEQTRANENAEKAMERTARAQADATKQQAKTNENAEKGLRQERLKNAIEHMGHTSSSVRLGGAYELFHLAEDNQELRRTVFDILCAHVRRTTRGAAYRKEYPAKPSEEIQTLLTRLFVQEHDVFAGLRIHLAGSWLKGAHLQNARLQKANLQGAQLQRAELELAQLQETYLGSAQFQHSNLLLARFQGADLGDARLQGAELGSAELQGANLQHAQLQGANLVWAQLQGANLQSAHLQGAVSEQVWPPGGFAECMRLLAGRESALSRVIFSGGLTKEDVDSILESLSSKRAQVYREQLEPHIDQPPSNELPKGSGAQTGAYTPEQAEAWIKEYEEAISESPTPETDDKGEG